MYICIDFCELMLLIDKIFVTCETLPSNHYLYDIFHIFHLQSMYTVNKYISLVSYVIFYASIFRWA